MLLSFWAYSLEYQKGFNWSSGKLNRARVFPTLTHINIYHWYGDSCFIAIKGTRNIRIFLCWQVLPTNVRAVGMGVCSSMSRIGAMVTPFVAQVLISQSFYYVVLSYSSPLLICTFVSLLLKVETKGMLLVDSSRTDVLGFGRTDNKDYQSFSRWVLFWGRISSHLPLLTLLGSYRLIQAYKD